MAEIGDISSTLRDDPADFDCELCHGARFVRVQRPADHPRFGKAEPCQCVLNERDDVRRDRLERASNIGALRRFTFDSLAPGGRLDDEGKWFSEAYRAVTEFVDRPEGWLVLCGLSGSGKTHLAAAFANKRIELGLPVLYMVVADLLDQLRSGYSSDEEELKYDALFEQVKDAPVLVLDDLDAVAGTAWAKEKLLQLVNHRYNFALPTIFTTTTSPQDLDERFATRLCDESMSRVLMLHGRPGGLFSATGGMTRQRLQSFSFAAFDATSTNREERESLEHALQSSMRFADDPVGTLTLQGVSGCGKTHLAAAIGARSLQQGRSVHFASVPELLDAMRNEFDSSKAKKPALDIEEVRETDLLILDDLGEYSSSTWSREKLVQIVNYRLLRELPLVITTDMGLNALYDAYPRIASRIADPATSEVVAILAPHYRLGRTRSPEPAERSRSPYPKRR